MKHVNKSQNGIKIYRSLRKVSERTKVQRLILTAAHIMAVWFVIAAWWEVIVSVFPAPAKSRELYTVFFIFSVISVIICNMRRKQLWIPLYLAGASCLLWMSRKALSNVINYLADSYLIRQVPGAEMPGRGAEELYNGISVAKVSIYHVEPISEWHMAYILGLFVIPLLLIWAMVLRYHKGKSLSLFLISVSFIFVLVAGYVPSLLSVWMLILAGGFYHVVCDCESGRAAYIRGISAVLILGVMAAVVTPLSIPIDKHKLTEGGIYQKTHAFIKKDIIAEVQGIFKNEEEEKKQEKPKENKKEQETEKKNSETENDKPEYLFSKEESVTMGKNLNLLSEYQPDYINRMVLRTLDKPEKTVYYPLFYGGDYENGYWGVEYVRKSSPGEDVWLEDILSDSPDTEYKELKYTDNLDRLVSLCKPYIGKEISEVSDFIQKEFEENTVYDYKPGIPPKDEDFAEYFLFENKKGFCVHFATTATLMYRICECPARYVQGYAVPADAFVLQKDGTYAAQVTGIMGHAWCEVYDAGSRTWTIKEHTLPYRGDNPYGAPAADSDMEKQHELEKYNKYLMPVAISVPVILIIAVFCGLRAAIIRKRRRRSFKSAGRGLVNVYSSIYEISLFFKKNKESPLSRKGYENIVEICPKKWESELDWLYWASMETMFYDKISDREERKKAAEFYFRLSGEMLQMTKGWQRFRYRYLKCF